MAKREDLIKQFALAEEKQIVQKEETATNPDSPAAKNQSADIDSNHHGGTVKRKSRKARKKFFSAVYNILTDKTLSKMLNVFLFCMIVNVVEYFVLINYLHIPTKGALGKFLGALIILGYMYTARLKPHNVGLSTNPRAIRGGLRNAFIFNLAIIPAYILEYAYLVFFKRKEIIIRIFAYDAPISEVGAVYFIASILLLVVITALSVVMLEVLFRGILTKMGKGKFGFWQTAVIVSLFYSLWYLVIPLSKLTAGYSMKQIISLCIFYLIFEFLLSLKWCMCARATGSIWLSVFDHFIFNFSVNLIHVINMTDQINTTDNYRNYRLIIIQIVSFIICFSYYKMKMRKKEKLLQAVGVRSIYSFDSLAEMSEEDVSRQAERIKTADGEIDAEYLKLLERNEQKKHSG
ncbi:MAG: CPBP family intramembrane metalloprotease [Clostridia bacterium]|nr:CPBP family intramembrane metalloprotease [Clostridia bacterium]